MRLLLISVGRLPWYQKDAPLYFFYTPRQGLPYIASVTPPEWDVTILDGVQVSDIDFDQNVDLVGFSFLTPFSIDSYKAADEFRSRGVKVVMGGVHTTLMPDEAKLHADAVVTGEGEEIWPQLLDDFKRGELRDFYSQTEPVQLDKLPRPAYSKIVNTDYSVKNGFQLVRGCPHGKDCKFCIVPKLFGTKYRTTPIDKAIENIADCVEQTGVSGVNVSASCALNHKPYIREFAQSIKPLNITWCGGALLHLINDAEYIKLLAESGCNCIYTETEVTSELKDPEKFKIYCDVAKMLHDNGIAISYNFTVGIDTDTKDVFNDVETFIDRTDMERKFSAVQLYVPWPNTDDYNRLDKEDRILDKDWSHYDNMHVVFQPKQMTIEELGVRVRGRDDCGHG